MKTTIQDLESEQRKAIARVVTEIGYTIQDISSIYEDAFGLCVCFGRSEEWYIFQNREEAEEAVRKYWEEMAEADSSEFACIIGEKRLVQWGRNQSDEFGISNANEFFDAVANHCEETLASYDGNEYEINGIYYYRRN